MEARKITVIETSKQSKKIIMSAATTLGELKADFIANDISFEDMDFYEGLTRTELKSNDSILPTNVPYKGTITNELVFMLTTTNKKITSGAMSRKEIYSIIKNHSLEQTIKENEGKSYTNCSTDTLMNYVSEYYLTEDKSENKPEDMPEKNAESIVDNSISVINKESLEGIIIRVKGILQELESLTENNKKSSNECPYTDEELDDMFNGML